MSISFLSIQTPSPGLRQPSLFRCISAYQCQNYKTKNNCYELGSTPSTAFALSWCNSWFFIRRSCSSGMAFPKIASLPRPRRFSLRSSSCCCMSCSFSTTCTNRETWSSRADAWTFKTHPKRPSKLDQAGPVRYHQLHLCICPAEDVLFWKFNYVYMTIMTRTTIHIM